MVGAAGCSSVAARRQSRPRAGPLLPRPARSCCARVARALLHGGEPGRQDRGRRRVRDDLPPDGPLRQRPFAKPGPSQATQATVERVLKELVRLAFYDITEILAVDDQGKVTLRDPASLPKDLRRAIVGIKPVQVGEEHQYEYKFADKQKALDSLARYLQMFKDTLVVENVFRVVQLREMVRLAFYDITEILAVDKQGNVTMRDPTSLQ